MSEQWNPRNLPKERPSSFDKEGKRLFLYPADVKGYFRNLRSGTYGFLILLFLFLPWTKWNGEQTILLKLTERRFTFFGESFWAHDAPFIFFPLIIAVLLIALLTSTLGRVWCGWACPQTVFIDFIYRRIETWLEGNHIQRKKLDSSPLTLKKASVKTLKWILFWIASLHIAHSFIAFFVGADELVYITLKHPSENWTLFLVTHFLSFLFLFDFGWFREQFCIIMCPYGRFQSVLMGAHSLAVLYDKNRGEPRKGVSLESQGDCIDCFKCVNVCPTGIDIREGLQLECIACTACIDACNEVMEKIEKPKGLIRYASEVEIESGKKRKSWTLRSKVYLGLILGLVGVFSFLLSQKQELNLQLLRTLGAPYQIIERPEGNIIVNSFRIHINNQLGSGALVIGDLAFEVENKNIEIIAPALPHKVKVNSDSWITFTIKFLESEKTLPTTLTLKAFSETEGKDITRNLKIKLLKP